MNEVDEIAMHRRTSEQSICASLNCQYKRIRGSDGRKYKLCMTDPWMILTNCYAILVGPKSCEIEFFCAALSQNIV